MLETDLQYWKEMSDLLRKERDQLRREMAQLTDMIDNEERYGARLADMKTERDEAVAAPPMDCETCGVSDDIVRERNQLRHKLEEARAACEDARETLGEIRALAEMGDPGGCCETITKWARRCCNRLDGGGGV